MLAQKPELQFSDEDPGQAKARDKRDNAQKEAIEKDEAMIGLIRSELHSGPSI
jgi:hypothetical protein